MILVKSLYLIMRMMSWFFFVLVSLVKPNHLFLMPLILTVASQQQSFKGRRFLNLHWIREVKTLLLKRRSSWWRSVASGSLCHILFLWVKMHLIGITGGISTGKSTVSNFIKTYGYTFLDGDVIARQVVEPGTPALKKIQDAFGDTVIHEDGSLDREALGSVIFGDAQKRKVLNSIVHPAIYREIFRRCLICLWRREDVVFLDLPLLYESGAMVRFLTRIIVVYCTPELQLDRLMKRNELSREDAVNRISSQMNLEEKRKRADIVIDNSYSLEKTKEQVDEAMMSLKRDLIPSWKYYFFDACLLCLGSVLGWVIAFWYQNLLQIPLFTCYFSKVYLNKSC